MFDVLRGCIQIQAVYLVYIILDVILTWCELSFMKISNLHFVEEV